MSNNSPAGGTNGPASSKGDTEKKPQTPHKRTVTITVTLPTCITGLIILVLGFFWIFFLGIMLGRGHSPEEAIPDLHKIMPQAAQEPPAVVTSSDSPGTDSPSAAGGASLPQTVLSGQELEFQNSLKPKPGLVSQPQHPQKRLSPKEQTRKNTRQSTAKELQADGRSTKAAVSSQKAEREGKKNVQSQPEKKELFDYQFQVAAFRQKNQAEAFSKKLQQMGLKVTVIKSVENGKDWYRNIILFRGAPDDVDRLREQLREVNITTLIRKEKKVAR